MVIEYYLISFSNQKVDCFKKDAKDFEERVFFFYFFLVKITKCVILYLDMNKNVPIFTLLSKKNTHL